MNSYTEKRMPTKRANLGLRKIEFNQRQNSLDLIMNPVIRNRPTINPVAITKETSRILIFRKSLWKTNLLTTMMSYRKTMKMLMWNFGTISNSIGIMSSIRLTNWSLVTKGLGRVRKRSSMQANAGLMSLDACQLVVGRVYYSNYQPPLSLGSL